MKTRARFLAILPRPNNTSPRCGSERNWRCSLPPSNVFLDWAGSNYEGPAAQMTKFASLPSPKTSANWPTSFLLHSKCAKSDKKCAWAGFHAPFSASVTCCPSTEPAQNGHLLRSSETPALRDPATSIFCRPRDKLLAFNHLTRQ